MKFLTIPSEFLNCCVAFLLMDMTDNLGATWCVETENPGEQETLETGICAAILDPEPAHILADLQP